jgi:hypothetical protein
LYFSTHFCSKVVFWNKLLGFVPGTTRWNIFFDEDALILQGHHNLTSSKSLD